MLSAITGIFCTEYQWRPVHHVYHKERMADKLKESQETYGALVEAVVANELVIFFANSWICSIKRFCINF